MLGNKVKELRKKNKMTQQQLANILEMSQSTIGMIEKNKQGASNDTLKKIASVFNVTVDYLLSDSEDENIEINPVKLNKKDEKDIEKALNATLEQLENQEGLMLSGNPIDETDWEFIKNAIRNGLEYSKKVNKEKYTPKKYKK